MKWGITLGGEQEDAEDLAYVHLESDASPDAVVNVINNLQLEAARQRRRSQQLQVALWRVWMLLGAGALAAKLPELGKILEQIGKAGG